MKKITALSNHIPAYPKWMRNTLAHSPYLAGDPMVKPQPLSPLLQVYNDAAAIKQKIQLNTNLLFRTYLHDTTGTYSINDVIAYLKQHGTGTTATEKLLACAYVSSKQTQKAQSKLDSLSQNTTLTDFCKFHTALNQLNQLTPSTIDTTNAAAAPIKQKVQEVALSPTAKRAKAGAQALLQFAGLQTYAETFVPLSNNLRTSNTSNNDVPAGTVVLLNQQSFNNDYVKVYPNPTNGKFYIEYAINRMNKGAFVLTDISGKEIWRKILTENSGKININQQTPPGIYLYQIIVNDEVFSVDKLIITQ